MEDGCPARSDSSASSQAFSARILLLEKELEIHEKEAELLELKRCAEERLRIIDQLRQSYYYRLGYILLATLALSLKRFIQFLGKSELFRG